MAKPSDSPSSRVERKTNRCDDVDGRVGHRPSLVGHEQAMEVDDSVLWSRARTGDSEAFGMLFERHARTIYNFCFRRVGNWATAEDPVSIVFLEAWRRLDKPLPNGKELAWLFGIATNVVRNRRRTERRHAAALKRVPSRVLTRALRMTAISVSTTRSSPAAPSARCTPPPSRARGFRTLRLVRA